MTNLLRSIALLAIVALVSSCKKDWNELGSQLIVSDNLLSHYQKYGENIVNRQELDVLFYRNGIAYVSHREVLLNMKNVIGPTTGALVIDQPVVNIDSEFDLELANRLLT